MNQVTVDGCVQRDPKLYDEIANFNISVKTGVYTCVDNSIKTRYTYYRVIFPQEIDERMEEIIQVGSMIRIYGKLDSEIYITKTGKYVYNKIIYAEKIVRVRYDKDINEYVEVL